MQHRAIFRRPKITTENSGRLKELACKLTIQVKSSSSMRSLKKSQVNRMRTISVVAGRGGRGVYNVQPTSRPTLTTKMGPTANSNKIRAYRACSRSTHVRKWGFSFENTS